MNSEWDGITLAQWVYQMVVEKKTESAEFKAALELYGRKKLLALYQAEKLRREGK